MKKTASIIKWLGQLNAFWRSLGKSAIVAGTYVLASIGEKVVQDIFENNKWNQGLFPRLIIIVLIISAFAGMFNYIDSLQETVRKEEEARQNVLLYAYSLMDQYTAGQIEHIDRYLDSVAIVGSNPDPDKLRRQLQSNIISLMLSTVNLIEVVKSVYTLFESQFGRSQKAENRIDFEATFMTRSYLDGEITIPAYANRNGRQPISMSQRTENKEIYRKTITASVYSEAAPQMRIIPDTSEPSTGYIDLYTNQRQRIRSTLVFPVMCDKNRILGTLVIHCNQPAFFQERDRKFWTELLEIFGKRIAVEKVRLDIINTKNGTDICSLLTGNTVVPSF